MPGRDDELKSGSEDEFEWDKRISFRDYPSTGVVVLAALVSGLGWLAYKWSKGKRPGSAAAPGTPQRDQENAPPLSEPDDQSPSTPLG